MLKADGNSVEIEIRKTKELVKALKKFGPFLNSQAKAGCTIALFMREYVRVALQSDPTDNTILSASAPIWSGSGVADGFLIDEFTLVSRLPGSPGNFMSVKRVIKENVDCNYRRSLPLVQEFHTTVKDRIRYKTPERDLLLLVLGENLKTIMLMGKKLVSYKVDRGIHLTFKERIRSDRYIEVYLGGWLDEANYPLENYSAARIVNQLRKA